MAFETLTDDQLVRQVRQIADSCVRVVGMPKAERKAVRGVHGASPEQAGAMNAIFATLMIAELERRGVA